MNRRDHQPPANSSQLRAAMDSGQTRDKVDYPDPAVAPLGTDAEAGGYPPRTREVREQPIWRNKTHSTKRDGHIYPLLVLAGATAYLAIVWLSA